MLDTGSQISVCSYSMFIKLGGDPNCLDKSKSLSISSTTELRDDCILGVDVLHRAKIMIHSNGHQFALVARLERENGHIAKVRL